MRRLKKLCWIVGVLAFFAWTERGYAQANEAAMPPEVIPGPPALLQPATEIAPAEFSSGLSPDDPFLAEGPAGWGWYANLGVGLIKPHIKSRVTSATPIDPRFPGPVRLPIAGLDWTAMPDVQLGYRFARSQDELALTYRGVFTQGNNSSPGFDPLGAGRLRSRLSANVVDVDYVSREFIAQAISPALARNLSFRFGIRVASAFFDTQGVGQQILQEHSSNFFAGAGPHVGFEANRQIVQSPFAAYFRADAAGAIGLLRQRFSEVDVVNGAIAGAALDVPSQSTGIGIFGAEAGLRWLPNERMRFSAGYLWERWWNLGATANSNAELTLQGIFLRGEFNF